MSRRYTRVMVLVTLGFLASCDSPFESPLEQRQWEALGIREYEFVYTALCFCGFPGPNPAKLTVTNGVVTRVEATSGATLPSTTPPAATYPTIDSLFALLNRTEKSAVKEVGFDDTYHYPKLISLDPIKNAIDDEVVYKVEGFIPLSGR